MKAVQTKEAEFTGITTTILQLKDCLEALNTLFNQRIRNDRAFRMKSLYRQVNEIFETFEAKRIALCQKYGALSGDNYEIKPENIEVFEQEMAILNMEEHQIIAKPLKLSELGSVELSVQEMVKLDWLIVE